MYYYVIKLGDWGEEQKADWNIPDNVGASGQPAVENYVRLGGARKCITHHYIPVRPESESRSVKPIMTVLNLQMVREREQKGVGYQEFGREIKRVKLEDKVWPCFRQDPASRRGYDSLPGLAMLHTDQNLRTQTPRHPDNLLLLRQDKLSW